MITPEQSREELERRIAADELAEVYARRDRWVDRSDSASARIAQAERTLEKCRKHLGVDVLAEGVRDLLVRYFPGRKLRVLGPFGLGHEVAIHVEDPDGTSIAGASFRPKHHDDGSGHYRLRLHLIDWSHNTGEYPPGSLGSVNQLNFTVFDEPATLHDIVALLDAQVRDHERWVLGQEREEAPC